MDAGSSSRPVRRRAHVCRMCDSAFTCKAELLEHEQEAHMASSVSTPSSKRRSVTAHSGGTSPAGASPIMLHTPAKKAIAPVNVTSLAANLLVDHEEVYESHRTTHSPDNAVQKTAVISTASVQQKFASGSSGSSNAVKQINFSSAENRQASSQPVARSHDQAGEQSAEGRTGTVANTGTSVASQSTDSPSRQLSQPKVIAVQNRGPVTAAAFSTSASAAETITSKSPEGDVIKALGLKRKGGTKDVTEAGTVASTDDSGVEEDDTKPPVSDHVTDASVSAVDSRHVAEYEVLGTINAEPRSPPRVNVAGSDAADRNGRNAAMQSVLLPTFTKEEATDCVAGLHQGDSYAASVNNDELQLLAAVSSTRSRDIVTQPSSMPTPQEPEPQQMTDIVVSDLTDIVEQEVVLETTEHESEPRRQTKKRTSAPKSPVCVVKLPMMPHEFTSTDGAKKRMVAITVARSPRMVSVLLRNRGNADPREPKEQQESVEETAPEATLEQPSDEKKKDDANTNIEPITKTVVETLSAESIAAEAATAARAIEFPHEPPRLLKPEAEDKAVKPEIDVCLYCEQVFPSEELAEHIALDHVCDQCGRKFRQPANLRKVRVNLLCKLVVCLYLNWHWQLQYFTHTYNTLETFD